MSTISSNLLDGAEAFLAEDFSIKRGVPNNNNNNINNINNIASILSSIGYNTTTTNIINNNTNSSTTNNNVKNNARVALADQIVTRRCILDIKSEPPGTLLTVPVIKLIFHSKVTRNGSRGVLISKDQDAYILKFFRKGVYTFDDLLPSDKIWAYIYSKNLIQMRWDEISGKFDPSKMVYGTVQVPSAFTGKVRVKPQEVGGKSTALTLYAGCHSLEFGEDSTLWVDDEFLCSWNTVNDSFNVTEDESEEKKDVIVGEEEEQEGDGGGGYDGDDDNDDNDVNVNKFDDDDDDDDNDDKESKDLDIVGTGKVSLPSFSEFVRWIK